MHYFEDGNVQLHTNYDRVASVNVGTPEETAKEVSKALSKIESDFQVIFFSPTSWSWLITHAMLVGWTRRVT